MSIEFHERGKNHKENVAKKISEIKKKSLEKAKEEEKMSKEFAAMEEAAMKAYQEDLKRLGQTFEKTECAAQTTAPKKQEEKKQKRKKEKIALEKIAIEAIIKGKGTKGTPSSETKEWVRGFSPEGYTYYYNTVSGESQWEKPEEFEDTHREPQMAAQWIEGVSEDGRTYYYNTEMGISTWEKPDGFVSPSHENSQDENGGEENSETILKEAELGAGKEGSESELLKPKQNFKQKTQNDEVKEKHPRPKKISPYGEWEEVKQESIAEENAVPISQEACPAASKTDKRYGEWEEITEEEDPYEKVDLELPGAESDSQPAPVLKLPEDAKVIFKEKTVTSLGDTTAGIPVFKKRKFENGKSRNIRQRWDDH
ncbi:hypothetical protein lerEdw1_013196 [Lerista edwardsae]|nr:hypothetical protein lerEdw1_013196 [Lerista edwardsae]